MRSMRGALARNAASMRVCQRSAGSKTWESDERTRDGTGISSHLTKWQLWQRASRRQDGGGPWWPNCVRLRLCSLANFVLGGTGLQWRPMRDPGETTVFHIRGTDPAKSEQVVY